MFHHCFSGFQPKVVYYESEWIICRKYIHCEFFFQLRKTVTPFEVMVSLIAAMAHDIDHPGVNQGFLIATANHLAALYDVSIDYKLNLGLFSMSIIFQSFKHFSWSHINTLKNCRLEKKARQAISFSTHFFSSLFFPWSHNVSRMSFNNKHTEIRL